MTGAIIQAGISSPYPRIPILDSILGRPMLELMIERLKYAETIDRIIIATTVSPDDDQLESYCDIWNVDCYRGSVDNVLSRYFSAARKFNVDVIVRLFSNCPLVDPGLVDQVVNLFLQNMDRYDFCSNLYPPTFPVGLGVEVLPISTLGTLNEYASDSYDRERVTSYIGQHRRLFRIGNISDHYDRSDYRWSVNSDEELEFVTRVYETLYKPGLLFGREDIFDLLGLRPEMIMRENIISVSYGGFSGDDREKTASAETGN